MSSTPVIFSAASTKGGVGKTTLIANLGGIMADFGFRVLLVDADGGIVELLLGKNSSEEIENCISQTIFPNLDIVLSNNISADIQVKVQNRHDRAFLLKTKFMQPYFAENYDIVLIDTQGAVGVIQDAAAFASHMILSPIKPEILSAREFMTGTSESLDRLEQGRIMGLQVPKVRALIYASDRTRDCKSIAEEIKNYFNAQLDDSRTLLRAAIPSAKSFKEAATLRIPVHCHEQHTSNKSASAYQLMHELVFELFPSLKDAGKQASCFDDMRDLIDEEQSN